ncbi:MAG: hypothetical protein ABIC40_02955 [bacterium]
MTEDHASMNPNQKAGDPQETKAVVNTVASSNGEKTGKKKKGAEHSSEELLRRVIKHKIVLFHDQRGQPYARIHEASGYRTLSVKSEEFSKWLSMIAWKEMTWSPGRESLNSARRILESMACHDGPEYKLHVRVALHEETIWIDLDGSRAVKIMPGRWEIVADPPILFRSFSHQKPLPEPVSGSDPLQILNHINLRTESEKKLFMAWLVVSFVPNIPIPVLILCGPSYSGKSTILSLVRRLMDPCTPEYQGRLSKLKDFTQIASQYRLLIFDNESKITVSQSDLLCGSVTGQGDAKRVLYTDEDTLVMEYRNVIGVSGVRLVVTQPDLMSRSLLFELEQLPNTDMHRESAFWKEFDATSGEILGGVFDVLAGAMAIEKLVKLSWTSRLSDFTHWAVAVARTLGWNEEEFILHFKSNVNRQHEAILDSDPLARVIINWIEKRGEWEGTMSDLLTELNAEARQLGIDPSANRWPKTPQLLSGSLSYLTPCLEHAGVSIGHIRKTSGRIVTIRLVNRNPELDLNRDNDDDYDDEDERSVIPKPASTLACDVNDTYDDDFPHLSGGSDV